MCGKHGRLALARARVCVYKIKIKCKEKNGTFHVYYPLAIVCCSYGHVCYSYALACYSYVLVCTRMLLVCHSYVTRMSLVCYSYVTRMLLVCTRVVFWSRSFLSSRSCVQILAQAIDHQKVMHNLEVRKKSCYRKLPTPRSKKIMVHP